MVTIAIVVRDDFDLSRLLRGLSRSLKRARVDWPILVIDNASSPRFQAELQRLRASYPEITVSTRAKNSMAEARADALASARSPWLAFLDSDCRVSPGWATRAATLMTELHPRAEIAAWSGPSVFRGPGPLFRALGILGGFFPAHGAPARTREVDHIPTSHLFLRRSAAIAVGGFAAGARSFERTGEDMSLSRRLRAAGGKILLVPSPGVLHAQRGGWRQHLQRMRRYGAVHGRLAWRFPATIFSRRFAPLAVAVLGAGLVVILPVHAGITAALGFFLAAWAWGGITALVISGSVTAYAFGTIEGMLAPVRRKP